MRNFARIILPFMTLLLFCFTSISQAYTVSGTINNPTNSTGRLYVMLADSNDNSTGYGTSIAGITGNQTGINYSIRGVRTGDFKVQAFLDTRSTGHPYAGSPIGGSNTFAISASDVTVTAFSVAAQTGIPDSTTWWNEASVMAMPMSGGALVRWDTPTYNGIEIPNSYDVCWGTNSTPDSTTHTNGSCVTNIPSADDGNYLATGLTNGTTYNFNVIAKLDGYPSASKITSATIGTPAGGHTVTVNIALPALPPAGPMFVVLMGDTSGYGTVIASPASSTFQTVTVPGVQDGTYRVKAIIDKNQNSRFDIGDLSNADGDYNATMVTVNSSDTIAPTTVIDPNAAVQSEVTTELQFQGNNPTPSYGYDFRVEQQLKRAAHIVIDANPSKGLTETTDMGFTTWGNFSLWPMITSMPATGNAYTGTVTYTDGTTDPITFTVTGVLTAPPYQTYPLGTTSGSNRTSPRFAWAPNSSGLPTGPFFYYVKVIDQNNNSLWKTAVSFDQLSAPYAGSAPLTVSHTYNWGAYIVDAFGNRAVRWNSFTPSSSNSVDITGFSPATLACNDASRTITINGSGFSATAANNQVFFNNTISITPSTATSDTLTVTLPACANGATPGPISVTTNGTSAASSSVFTPTHQYSFYVKSLETSSALSGVTVSVNNRPDIVAATTDNNGLFTLTGIPIGVPYALHLTKNSYSPVNSAYYMNYTNITPNSSRSFSLPLSSTYQTTWGGTADKSIIRTKAITSADGSSLAGVVLTAYSTLFRSNSVYQVLYDGNCSNTSNTSTQTDGLFCIKNIIPGDAVVVTASKTGYIFQPRTYAGYPGELEQSSVQGAVTPYITSQTSAVPNASITINGGNFNATPANNTVLFTGGQYGSVTAGTTTQLTVTVPCGAQSGPVTVCTNSQCSTSSTNMTIPAPTITNISPNPATYGDMVVITGTNFYNCWGTSGVITLTMAGGTVTLPYTGGDSVSINTTAPNQTITDSVTVTTAGGTVVSGASLSVIAPVVNRTLTINLPGTGTGTVTSTAGVTPQLSCSSPATSCTASVDYGASVTLSGAATLGSTLAWSGVCSTQPCDFTMDGDKTAIATFTLQQNLRKGTDPSYTYYGTLRSALTSAVSGDIILARMMLLPDLTNDATFDRSTTTVILRGGYTNTDFTARTATDFTSVIYPLTIKNGTLVLDQVIIK